MTWNDHRVEQSRRWWGHRRLIERISYANFAMFVPIWLGRKILTLLGRNEQAENRINHPIINNLLTKIFSSEAGWLRKRTLPFGVSIICVARKI